MVERIPPEVDRAIEDARALQREADAGWPNGYDATQVLARGVDILKTIDLYCELGSDVGARIAQVKELLVTSQLEVAW